MIIECKYKMTEGDVPKMESCASNAVIDEHIDCISAVFSTINVTIEVDDEWGFCKILAVNGNSVLD